MSDETNDTNGGTNAGAPSQRTELLRRAADGELTADQAAALEAHLQRCPEDRMVVAFERSLRTAVASLPIEGPSVAVRERIERMRSGAAVVGAVGPESSESAGGRRRIGPWWWGLAAVVAVAAGVGMWEVLAPPARPTGGELVTVGHRASLISFVRSKHEECELYSELVAQRFRIGPAAAAPEALGRLLGRVPDLGAAEAAGVRYLGAAECAVPGRGNSVHIVYGGVDDGGSGADGRRTGLVSLFIQQDRDELAIEPGRTYRMVPLEGGDGPAQIYVWRRGGLVYFLVSRSAEEMDAIRAGLGVALPTGEM